MLFYGELRAVTVSYVELLLNKSNDFSTKKMLVGNTLLWTDTLPYLSFVIR